MWRFHEVYTRKSSFTYLRCFRYIVVGRMMAPWRCPCPRNTWMSWYVAKRNLGWRGLKVANQVILPWRIILDYPQWPTVVTRVLGEKRQERRSGQRAVSRCNAALKMEEGPRAKGCRQHQEATKSSNRSFPAIGKNIALPSLGYSPVRPISDFWPIKRCFLLF